MSDDSFLQFVELDLANFSKNLLESSGPAILLFPPLLSRYRFLIHNFVQLHYPNFKTVSVGSEDSRRTALYSATLPKIHLASGLNNMDPSPMKTEEKSQTVSSRKKATRPSVQPYVPPPQRGIRTSANSSPSPNDKKVSKVQTFASSCKELEIQRNLETRQQSNENQEAAGKPSVPKDEPCHESSKPVSAEVPGSDKEGFPKVRRKESSQKLSDLPAQFCSTPTKQPGKKHDETLKLEEQILSELTEAFGRDVDIHRATQPYHDYSPTASRAGGSWTAGYAHVLEAYDFPASFTSTELFQDLQLLTMDFFELKWVDETHALAVFSDEGVAKKVSCTKNAFSKCKVRPFLEASEAAKLKARNSIPLSVPDSRSRPETSASAARRLVAGALGLTINVPKEKQEVERRQLKGAKQEKQRVVKQKEDIWDGNV